MVAGVTARIQAKPLLVAVASNFATPINKIILDYQQQTTIEIDVVTASSGKLYTQIKNGAPYDVLLSGDQRTPKRLAEESLASSDSQFTYAVGQLVLWSSVFNEGGESLKARLQKGSFNYFAIANPNLAPYGFASKEVLDKLSLTHKIRQKQVTAESVGQTFQLAYTGNAELGFVALSQLVQYKEHDQHMWLIPESFYTPIKQDAILLNTAKNKNEAKQFLAYLQSDAAQQTIKKFGYRLANTKSDGDRP